MSSKEKIYAILHDAGDVVSGEEIRARLGVSRVAVWKHIQGMVKSGIAIESSPKGYRLLQDPDSLSAYDFGPGKHRIHIFDQLPSTMDKAIELAREHCPANTVVIAQCQTSGRGRLQRQWLSGEGGLYFSIVIRPDLPIALASIVNLAAAVDMCSVLRVQYGVEARVKWPNDILVNNCKICGILSQMEVEGDQVHFMTIGIGLNVNNSPETSVPDSVSLRSLLGHKISRKNILASFLDRFEKRIMTMDPEEVVREWKEVNCTIGKQVHIKTLRDSCSGTAMDLDTQGGLVLQLEDGSHRTMVHGDCFFI